MKTQIYAAPAVKGLSIVTTFLCLINPVTVGPDYIVLFYDFFLIRTSHGLYQMLNKLKIKRDVNKQNSLIVDLHFVKSE